MGKNNKGEHNDQHLKIKRYDKHVKRIEDKFSILFGEEKLWYEMKVEKIAGAYYNGQQHGNKIKGFGDGMVIRTVNKGQQQENYYPKNDMNACFHGGKNIINS